MALGRNIRRIREALGIGQKALAEAAGMKLMPLWQLEERDSIRSKYDFAIAAALGVPVELLVTGTEADIDAWLASRQRASDPRVIDVQAREVPQPGERAALPPLGAGVVTIREALPVVLEAMRACQHREELRTLLSLLVDHDAPAYRQRLGELLSLPPPSIAKGLIETGDFAGPAPSHDNHDPDSQHHSRKREPSR